jgi:signal transduction histidine kinase
MAAVAVELTAAQLRVDRCWIAILLPDEGRAVVAHDHRRSDLQSMKGEYRYSDFPEAAKQIEAGTLTLDDVQSDASFADEEKAGLAGLGIGAQLAACPRKAEGRVIWSLSVADEVPRSWARHEATLLEEAAERTWAALERARAEASVLRERERRHELEREFIANAAHELRTPLAAIVASVEALNEGGKDVAEDRERFLGHLTREAARLARLSDSLLLLARMDDQGDLPRSEVRVRELLRDVADELKERAVVPVSVDAAPNLSLVTNGGLLERAVVNLAENAGRHTEDGEIQLWARRIDGRVVLEVRDTGEGVSADVLERAFDRFYRGGARTSDGSGLGLAIAHQVVRALGGTLQLEPRDGGGTTARLSLPRVMK